MLCNICELTIYIYIYIHVLYFILQKKLIKLSINHSIEILLLSIEFQYIIEICKLFEFI